MGGVLAILEGRAEARRVAPEGLRFDWFEESEGFGSIAVVALHQDSFGFVWIGTREGIYRYDGERFLEFRSDVEEPFRIPQNAVNRFFEDSRGRLWVGMEGGVIHYDYSQERFVEHEVDGFLYSVALFIERGDGRLHILNQNGALLELDDTGRFRELSSGEEDWARCSFVSDAGSVFVGGRFGIRQYSGEFELLRDFDASAILEDEVNTYFTALALGDDGRTLWAGTTRYGVWLLDTETGDYRQLPSNNLDADRVGTILVDERGYVLVGTTAGLSVYSREGEFVRSYQWSRYDPKSIPTGTVYSMLYDRQGNLWVGTSRGGLSIVRNTKAFRSIDSSDAGELSLSKQKVTALYQDSRSRLWVGYHNESLDRLDFEKGESLYFDAHLESPGALGRGTVWDIAETSDGRMWIGSNRGGLSVLEAGASSFIRYRPDESRADWIPGIDVRGILPDGEENLWLNVHGVGIAHFDRERLTFRRYENLGRYWGEDFLLDAEGCLWVGTTEGLSVLLPGANAFVAWPPDGDSELGGELDEHIVCLSEDSRGQLWIGTRKGLKVLSKDRKSVKSYTRADGLPSVSIRSVVESLEGEIWVGTSGGLARFDAQGENFRAFFKGDGLLSNEFTERAAILDNEGFLLMGCEKGIVRFKPESIELNLVPPKVLVTGVNVNGEPVYPKTKQGAILKASPLVSEEVVFPAGVSSFGFRFAALDYISDGRVSYEYRLEGFDEQWVRNGSRSDCSYTNIVPGKYVFRVRASNSDGIRNDEGVSLAVTVLPFFWQTDWFLAGVVAILILAFVYILRLRTAGLARQRALLQVSIDEKTRDLQRALRELELQKAQMEDQNMELLDHRENLEELVEQRTSELVVAKERAEEADRLKTAFLENISHEIRTPMNAIMGFVNILRTSDVDEEEEKEYLSIVEQNGETLTRLIDDIIELSILETSPGELRSEATDIHAFFQKWHAYLAKELQLAEKKGIEAKLSFQGKSKAKVLVALDPVRVGQILKNLLDNAAKFTDEGVVEIRYGLEDQALFFEVSDTGIGIPENKLAEVFTLFRKIRGTQKRLFRGTGLGLAMVKRVVDLIGGEIKLESEEGKGTRVFLRVPVKDLIVEAED
ncbi:hypothetical protein IEN85_07245 [Pelagicoccus sp. NFK12]|uniref:histidine kinase n=1 Tax=Pelagicoccus enzymogenes TaxID=2773457 RepID=A0A927F7H3_9BACT|nr:hybrid sensor histidine kinase/response regulator [Pelagicoccus enzymogenes]MBD5779284.1 hypothetical protein [Pelagicoccus enzymogenes]